MTNPDLCIVLIFVSSVIAFSSTMAETQPDAAMLAPVEKIARFIETCEDTNLSGFAESGVVIIENFTPHLFSGPDAVALWAKEMRNHLKGVTDLKHRFGPARNFTVDGEIAFLSLPTNWTGIANGHSFSEDGGWAFVLVEQGGEWRVRNYGWAVTGLLVE